MPTDINAEQVQVYYTIDGKNIPVGTIKEISITDLGDAEHDGRVYTITPGDEPVQITYNALENKEFVFALYKALIRARCNNWLKMHGYPKRRRWYR